ncbi:Flagellum-specific peptidoglycan hydrolase FlgJ [Alkalibacterium putridalgicola]|uniref:Peptidoglycan hydrolase n=1 Tax=Alkalibacterium putridalgicola TaxID=426703 RepID=A0A1H7QL27_9LACT|nr:glucosaminidase domain-containing protein [Alkalibacterium putridalgicola]GEK88416.1 hypothetical protein APU01nite_04550 [Alkalibacterium putridalgicola]SEL48830.1 Flagellum-specific peptidoglycan hydrolase FlgJ [Alkalibacterium putridalgicola]
MKKYKAFGIIMSSMLILGAASTTTIAVAESVDETAEMSTQSDGESLNRLFNELETITFDSSSLSEEQIAALEGLIDGTYSVMLEVDENTTYIGFNEVDERVISYFENQEFLQFVSNENKSVTAEVSLSELYDLTELLEKESTTSSETEPRQLESVATAAKEEIPEASYTPKTYSTEDDVSYSRSSEVEELLHGGEDVFSTFGTMMSISSSDGRVAENGIYTVVSGDTFNDIASSFNLKTRQLQEWNGHVSNINSLIVGTELAVTRRGVEALLSDADKARLYRGGAEPVYTIPQEFIDDIATQAIKVSNLEGEEALWPSLMIAQAAHESNYGRSSLASPPYHNLSGIKGSHNGKSVLMWTWEVLDGVRVDVLAPFRHYPSYDASLQSYASLLRNGLSWSRDYYSGTWRSKTDSVWDVLDNGGLRGYATDPNYYVAIKRIIDNFDLTKYDTGNYYVRTGTFLGETFTQLQVNKLASQNKALDYRIEVDTNKTPYSYRRIESTEEFLGEAGAQRVIDQLRRDKGWGASMIATGNGTERHRVRSGFFNTKARAEIALDNFRNLSGYSASIEIDSDGKYRILTGFFNGASSARKGLAYMHELGWGASIIGTGNYTPHYTVRTGTFNTPNHVNSAEIYFNHYGWGSKQVLSTRTNPYYRIYAEGFVYEGQANTFVEQLSSQYNWGSTAFPVHK